MKRSSIVGFALIGIILLGFSWYNSVQFNARRRRLPELPTVRRHSPDSRRDSSPWPNRLFTRTL